MPLQILYQDEHLVAVQKPTGLLSHKTDWAKDASENAMHLLRDQLGDWVYLVHRLDRPTSGALLFAKSEQVASQLQILFSERKVYKTYLALVRGFTERTGLIDHPLHSFKRNKSEKKGTPKEALTEYKTLKQFEAPFPSQTFATSRFSLVEVQPLTGRTRQIRRHFKHIFHPILGDTAHGDGKQNQLFRGKLQGERLMLHAQSISFLHPVTNEKVSIESHTEPTFQKVITRLEELGDLSL